MTTPVLLSPDISRRIMRILFLATQDIESPGGLGRWLPIARELSKNGIHVTIAALHPDFQSIKNRKFFTTGVEINYLAQMHVKKDAATKTYFSTLELLKFSTIATLSFIKSAITSTADVIVVAKPHPMNSIAGILAKFVLRKKLVVDCDDYEAETNKFTHQWQKFVVIVFERMTPRYADLTITNTQFMKNQLIHWGINSDKIYYLPNGVDSDRFVTHDHALQEINQLKLQLGIQGKKIIAYVGSLSLSSHPIDILIRAYAIINKQIPGSVLVIVGGGEDYDKLIQLSSDLGLENSIIFCGRIPPEHISTYYRIADVSTDPVSDDIVSRSRCPIKLFESWANGIPFVSANVGDRQFLLGDPPAGLLAVPGDPQSLADSILKVLEDESYALLLSQRGKERALAFKWSVMVKQLEQNLQKLFQ